MLSKVSVIVLLTVLSIAATGRAEGEKPNGKKLYNIKLKETVANQDGFTFSNHFRTLSKAISPFRSSSSTNQTITPPASWQYNIGSFKGYSMYLTSNEKQVLESMNEVEVQGGLNKRDEDKEAWKLEEFSPQAGNGQSYTQKCSSELWNLDRLDDRLDGLYRFTGLAADVDCYILDTGVMGSHSEFEGRVRERVNFADDNSVDDIYGHGTLVAGVTAGRTYGVAKMCNVISVKVMNGKGQGTTNTALAGLNWAVSKIKERKRKSVLNLSLSGPKDVVFDEAVLAAAKDNVPIIVAAGNSGADSCQESPAGVNHQNVLTVAAINRADERPGFSNFGSCVDVYAPGSEVKTASQKGNAETRTVDGTSVATPHVTGVIAQLLHAGYQSHEVTNLIRGHAFVNRIKGDLKGSPNKILQAYYVGKDK